ncbi:hypothetical protein HMPREF2898_04180 [Atopobium sp. HMSC064B08]|nr:hypothetical protein HMPREF2898_04180 [Atopobium sp. HMSC064B08]
MRCKNIHIAGSIPFRAALPETPRLVDSNAMSDEELRAAFMRGYQEAIKGDVVPVVPSLSVLHSESQLLT